MIFFSLEEIEAGKKTDLILKDGLAAPITCVVWSRRTLAIRGLLGLRTRTVDSKVPRQKTRWVTYHIRREDLYQVALANEGLPEQTKGLPSIRPIQIRRHTSSTPIPRRGGRMLKTGGITSQQGAQLKLKLQPPTKLPQPRYSLQRHSARKTTEGENKV